MRNNGHRTIQPHHNPLNHLIRAYIHRRRRLVQDEDARVAEECTDERNFAYYCEALENLLSILDDYCLVVVCETSLRFPIGIQCLVHHPLL